jgi:D-threo-aldose 1-dehydrogenase
MNQAEMLVEFVRRFDLDFVLAARSYTILDQTALDELLPLCLDRHVAVVVGAPYHGGLVTQAAASPDGLPRALAARGAEIRRVCERHGVPLKAAAIQFPFTHPAVASVLTGSRSAQELEENAALLDWNVPAQLWDELREHGLIARGGAM